MAGGASAFGACQLLTDCPVPRRERESGLGLCRTPDCHTLLIGSWPLCLASFILTPQLLPSPLCFLSWLDGFDTHQVAGARNFVTPSDTCCVLFSPLHLTSYRALNNCFPDLLLPDLYLCPDVPPPSGLDTHSHPLPGLANLLLF